MQPLDHVFMQQLPKKLLITGHYGAGKTTIAVALAYALARQKHTVTLVDLDIVNPYFRSGDFQTPLREAGVHVVTPNFSGSNLESPSLSPSVSGALATQQSSVLVDLGGDSAGAIAMKQYRPLIEKNPFSFCYVYNPFRYLTATPKQAYENLLEIEDQMNLCVSTLIGNANLGIQTTVKDVQMGKSLIEELSALCRKPIAFYAVSSTLSSHFPYDIAITGRNHHVEF